MSLIRVPLIARPTSSDVRRISRERRDGIVARDRYRIGGTRVLSPTAGMMLSHAAVGGGGPSGFLYYHSITIDHTQVGSSDSTDFPLLVSFTDASLKTVGNGGHVQSSSGFDIVPYPDLTLTTKMDFEIEHWDGTTGQIIAWIRVPTVSHSSSTVIYLAYDSTTVTTDQSNKTGVWGTHAKSILHFGNGSSLSFADSSQANETWGGVNTPAAATGQIYGGMLNSSNKYAIMSANNDPATSITACSFSLWVNPSSLSGVEGICQWADTTGSSSPAMLIQHNGTTLKYYADGNYQETSQTIATSTWYHLAVTLASGTTWKFYKNGSLLSTYTGGTSNFGSSNARFAVGLGFGGTMAATYDEFHAFTGQTLSGDRILAEYNNQKASSTLVTVGAETHT
jgi:Concanavalin A-like lectin/glucanases superfamily/Domain of unknown function (DUF2341)